MGLRPKLQRETAAFVDKRHGAWFIAFLGDQAQDATSDEVHDCASSLAMAKRLAREGAAQFGFEGAARWTETRPNFWELEMTFRGEEWDGIDD